MGWHEIWPYARTWWGTSVAIVTVAGAIYLWPKKMFDNFYWAREKWFDSKVRSALTVPRNESKVFVSAHGRHIRYGQPMSVAEISRKIGVPEKRVLSRLERLRAAGDVIACDGKWKANDLI